jgi:hypothetical protein
VIPRGVVQIPMGSATVARDFSQLAVRLQAALGCLGGVAPVVDSPVVRRVGRVQRPELVLIAASTGGPEALQGLLEALDEPVCPVVIALHIPAEHCGGLARHLATATGHRVVVGDAGPLPSAGIVLLQGAWIIWWRFGGTRCGCAERRLPGRCFIRMVMFCWVVVRVWVGRWLGLC